MVVIESRPTKSQKYIEDLIADFEKDGWETIRTDDEIAFKKNDIYVSVDTNGDVFIMNEKDYKEIEAMG